jgi:diguanylate cyclase (GGDEF)-like protein/PAS domain S-box-containing protein
LKRVTVANSFDTDPRVRVPRTSWLTLVLAVAIIVVASTLGRGLTLVFTVAVVAAGALIASIQLMRLALAIHKLHHSLGPCRGSGFLGLGLLFCGLGAAGAGISAAVFGLPAAAPVLAVATVFTAPCLLTGLLLLPGAAPTLGARLRRLLDGVSIGVSLLFSAWLLVVSPAGGTGPVALTISTTCCIALAATVVTGLRAVRYRPAALACSFGAALVLFGVSATAVVMATMLPTAWLVVGGTAAVVGPVLMLAGAYRTGDGPAEPDAVDDEGTFAGYPLLAIPVIIGVGAAVFKLATGVHFDQTSIVLGLAAVTAVAVRETLAARDIRRYARRLAGQQAHFRALVSGSTDVTVVLDENLSVRWQSPAAARQFGLSDQDVLDRPFTAMLHPDDAEPAGKALIAVLAGRQHVLVRARLRDGFGRWRDTESTVSDQRAAPEVSGVVVHVRDVGDRGELERTLDEVTWTDDLTGLANRRKLLAGIAEAQRSANGGGAVLVVELDRFASINDLHGPAVGDLVLVEVARRLRTGSGPTDQPARLTADSFAVRTEAPLVHAFALATRLATTLAEPYQLPGRTVHLSADIGVADLGGGASPEEVLRHADVARRRASQLGRGRVEAYDKSFESALLRRTELEQELTDVITRGELDLVYQPVLDLTQRHPVGVEALLRWRHPRLGAVPPAEFLPVAEELGLIDKIGVWVLHQACRQLSSWRRDGRDLWMSVNVSAKQLAADGFLAAVATAVDTHDVPAESVIVEVAEAALPDDTLAVDRLAGLRAIGVRTAIDHFGAGPTALAHLRRLPIDVLKIDRVLFSEPAGQTGPAAPIVDVVVSLARRLGIQVVAAGLETEGHVDVVRAAGCSLGQGFLLGHPSHAEHIEAFLEAHRTPQF